MIHILFEAMLVIGIIYGFLTGRAEAVGNAVVASSKEAISLAIAMAGVVALWSGLMEVAKEGGMISGFHRILAKPIRWFFPEVPKGHPAEQAILLNVTANILGLGWAATPAGLQAMKELQKIEEQHPTVPPGSASNSMCNFLILNVSSLQLISVNMIAYRSQYGSAAPMAIVGPALVATTVSTVAAVIFCRILCTKKPGRAVSDASRRAGEDQKSRP